MTTKKNTSGYKGNKNAKKDNPLDEKITLRCYEEEKANWLKQAARDSEKAGLKKPIALTQWIRDSLNKTIEPEEITMNTGYKFQVDVKDYADSVCTLMALAKGDTGGSRVAAEVLLSTYNGEKFQLNVTNLSLLDNKNYTHAMTVIHSRKVLSIGPHSVIENGDDIFMELWEQWESLLHIDERFKTLCSRCYGTGKEHDTEGNKTYTDCWHCDGRGHSLPEGLSYSKGV